MTRKELDALKAAMLDQKDKAADMEIVAKKLFGLLDRLSLLLPEEVKIIIEKYNKR